MDDTKNSNFVPGWVVLLVFLAVGFCLYWAVKDLEPDASVPVVTEMPAVVPGNDQDSALTTAAVPDNIKAEFRAYAIKNWSAVWVEFPEDDAVWLELQPFMYASKDKLKANALNWARTYKDFTGQSYVILTVWQGEESILKVSL